MGPYGEGRILIWDRIRGHHRQVELFRRAIRRGRTAHAFLFVGPEGIGKRLFARTLAQCLFCREVPDEQLDACGVCPACKQVQAGTHPDLLTIACPEGKRELPIELMIGPRERRGREGLCHELAMRPMSASRRIAIIDDAQTMNAESANALLKTLEEPPPGSMLMLLTPSAESLLPTIRSRCQPVAFSPLPTDDVAALLVDLGWVDVGQVSNLPSVEAIEARQVENLPHEVVALSEGSLHTARQLIEPELRTLRETLLHQLSQTPLQPLDTAAAVLSTIDSLGGDTATQRDHAGWVVRFAVEHYRGMLRADDSNNFDHLDRVTAQMERCLDSELHLRRSMPVPLCLEGLFDELSRIERGAVVV